MSYIIKVDDLRALSNTSGSLVARAASSLQGVALVADAVIGLDDFSGAAATSAKMYLADVHMTLSVSFITLLTEFQERVTVYRDHIEQCDPDVHAEFPETVIEQIEADLRSHMGNFEKLDAELHSIIESVDDVITEHGPGGGDQVLSDLSNTCSHARVTRENVGNIDRAHLHDLDLARAMLADINSLLGELPPDGGPVANWSACSTFSANPAFASLMTLGQQIVQQQAGRVDQLNEIGDRDSERNTKLLAEERTNQGWWKIAGGIAMFIGSAVVIVASGGSATPIVVAGWVTGLAGMGFAASDIYEGTEDVRLGERGDISTTAVNPLAAWFFNGDMNAYHAAEGVVLLSQMAVPIADLTSTSIAAGRAATMDSLSMSGRLVLEDSSDIAARAARKAIPETGKFDVIVHGVPDAVFNSQGARLTAGELAAEIRATPSWQTQEVRLLSCETAADPNGFAQSLANELGVAVKAPTKRFYVSGKGRIVMDEGGEWKVFKPK